MSNLARESSVKVICIGCGNEVRASWNEEYGTYIVDGHNSWHKTRGIHGNRYVQCSGSGRQVKED